jgi:hypothetical protein
MKVLWLNFRLTFQAETPSEQDTLNAVWVAFGSQLDDRPRFDDEDFSESGNLLETPTA